jgi:hypothetical protein
MIVIRPTMLNISFSGIFCFNPKSPKRPIDHPVNIFVVDHNKRAGARPSPEITTWAREFAES